MIFFFFSLLASIFGGISATDFFGMTIKVSLSVSNPFSGIISFWPFIVVLVVILLGILWYQAIMAMKKKKAGKSAHRSPGLQSPATLAIVTVFALALLSAPWVIESMSERIVESAVTGSEDQVEMILTVHGMDCGGCESLVNRRVAGLEGVSSVTSSHMREEVVVVYDNKKVSLAKIAQTIEDSGYTVVLE